MNKLNNNRNAFRNQFRGNLRECQVWFLKKANFLTTVAGGCHISPSIPLGVQMSYYFVNAFSAYTLFIWPLLYPFACTEGESTPTHRLVPACAKISNARSKCTTVLCLCIPPTIYVVLLDCVIIK